MLEDILLQVNKPARYIGQEWNIAKKDFNQAKIKFALCFPDLYEVGMSNLGLRIIYNLLNNIEDVTCERVFAPDLDMERHLRNSGQEIFSLESRHRLQEFDFLGFSLSFELDYTNVLNILDLGKLPLKASLRNQAYPLVIGGGACVMNPEPIAEFFDFFVIGEAEEVILEIIDIYRKYRKHFRSGQMSKEDLLKEFLSIEGIYVPIFYEPIYTPEGKLLDFKPKIKEAPLKIKKRFIRNLNDTYFLQQWLVPYISIVHDRISLEIMRGCPHACRFCQARIQYFPFRQRDLDKILNLAKETYRNTGYEEISLTGLSVSDYIYLKELLKILISFFKEKGISVSLPSLKVDILLSDLFPLITAVKKTGLTFAPEAGSERLRKIINKYFNVEEFFKIIEKAYQLGYQHLKLYFMIGLPFERKDDLEAIIDFATAVAQARRKVNAKTGQVHLSINTLIPKPHTPFQWLKMQDLDEIKYKQDYIRKKVSGKKYLKLSFHNCYMSFLEAVLSRADRRLSEVIISAFYKGSRFDAWENYFRFSLWEEAFSQVKIDPAFYLKEKAPDEYLPWDFLDWGIDKQTLLAEFNKAIAIK